MANIWGDVTENESGYIEFDFRDQDDQIFDPTTLRLDLYDYKTEAVLNSRLNVNLTPVSSYITPGSGTFKLNLVPADNVFRDSKLQVERHIAKITMTWSSGTKVKKFYCPFNVIRDTEPA